MYNFLPTDDPKLLQVAANLHQVSLGDRLD